MKEEAFAVARCWIASFGVQVADEGRTSFACPISVTEARLTSYCRPQLGSLALGQQDKQQRQRKQLELRPRHTTTLSKALTIYHESVHCCYLPALGGHVLLSGLHDASCEVDVFSTTTKSSQPTTTTDDNSLQECQNKQDYVANGP